VDSGRTEESAAASASSAAPNTSSCSGTSSIMAAATTAAATEAASAAPLFSTSPSKRCYGRNNRTLSLSPSAIRGVSFRGGRGGSGRVAVSAKAGARLSLGLAVA
ncbi:unnamed protein product, partial [Laminaria digitata]